MTDKQALRRKRARRRIRARETAVQLIERDARITPKPGYKSGWLLDLNEDNLEAAERQLIRAGYSRERAKSFILSRILDMDAFLAKNGSDL